MRRRKRHARDAPFVKSRGVWTYVGMCGYTSVREDGRTCCTVCGVRSLISGDVVVIGMSSMTTHRPLPVVPAASDPHGPVIIKYTVLASYLVTFIIGLVGNTLVLFVVSRYSTIRNRSVSNYYIWNLALADELFVLSLPFLCYATWTGDWIFGPAACKV